MITFIRSLINSRWGAVVALAFIAMIALAFALGDVTGSNAFGGLSGGNVAKVGDRNISLGEFNDALDNRLKAERNAVILGHNYMTPEIYHGVADFVGDSLQLAIKASEVEADVIVQCGVHFMAETSKIMNPAKVVLMPDMAAGCSLAESITADGVAQMRALYPGAQVVSYVNTTADVLRTLTQLGYVEQDGRTFSLSPQILDLGFAYLSTQSWIDRALPLMRELSERLGASTRADWRGANRAEPVRCSALFGVFGK